MWRPLGSSAKHVTIYFILMINSQTYLGLDVNSTPQQVLSRPLQQDSPSSTLTNSSNGLTSKDNSMKPLPQVALAAVGKVQTAQDNAQSPASANPVTTVAHTEQQPSTQISYGNEDPIQYLDYSSITDEILRKRTANFVYFNADFSHCRNCHKFFDIWKDLAVDIRWWKQVVKLFTINCSDEDNIEMCRRAGVTQFPQVKYYWIMSDSLERDGQRLHILGRSVHALRHLIMDRVLESYAEHNKLLTQRPTSPPNTEANPLAAFMSNPLIGQVLSGLNGGGSRSSLGGLMSAFTGKSGGNLLSSIMSNAQGLTQFIGAMSSASGSRRAIQPLPSNWPELELFEIRDIQQFVSSLPLNQNNGVGALLIMETQEFLYPGLEVMLDLSPYGNQLLIARILDERSQLSKNLTKRDDIRAPALIYVTSTREPKLIMTAPKYTNDEDLRRAFVRAFERRQIKYPVKRVWSSKLRAKPPASDGKEDEELLRKKDNVYMSDLTNTIRASLMEQVFRHPDLTDEQYNALMSYVYALINYFPFNNEEGLKFMKRLHFWLQNQVSPMDVAEYKKQFHDIDEVLPQHNWIACKSLINTKTVPVRSRKSGFLFENPAQIGKVVSNITRLFRGQQKQIGKLKNLFNLFTKNSNPVKPNQNQAKPSGGGNAANSTTLAPSSLSKIEEKSNRDDSPIERIIKSLTSGSLNSDSSILKLIASTLTGGSNKEATGKSKFAREYPCGAWKLAHVLVVNEYIRDSPRKDVRHVVLHSLYQYMINFYACPTCGNRVSDVKGEFRIILDDQLQDQGDSVLLLWKVHNRVSKRLEGEFRPGSPIKEQYPTESMCVRCRAPRAQNDLMSTPNWYEKQVLNFVVHHYRPQNFIFNSNSTNLSSAAVSSIVIERLHLIILFISLLIINGLIDCCKQF